MEKEGNVGRIIAIANQKGGVGKTTTAINLAACLAEAGQKILIIDIDPQGNTTSGFGLSKTDIEKTVYEVFVNKRFPVFAGSPTRTLSVLRGRSAGVTFRSCEKSPKARTGDNPLCTP